MQLELKHLTRPSYIHIFLYLLLGVILWGASFVGNYYSLNSPSTNGLFSGIDSTELLINIIVFILTLLNVLIISQLLTVFSFVSSRSFIGVIIFFLLITTWKSTHLLPYSHIALLLFILAVYQFFAMPQQEKPAEGAFLGAFFIGISSLLIRDFIFILPVCWIGFMILQTMTLRTFLASLMGILIPHILFLTGDYIFSFMSNPEELYDYNFTINFSFLDFSILNWIYVGFIATVLLILLISTYSDFNKKSVHTRRNLNFTVLMLLFFVVFCVLYKETSIPFLPAVGFLYSILFAHSFSIKKSNFYSILFLIFCTINIIVILYNFLF